MNWKITDLVIEGNALLGAYYFVSLSDDQNTVESQGLCTFSEPHIDLPINNLEERLVIRWVEDECSKNTTNNLKLNLEKQLIALKAEKISLPWVKPTFKIEF